MLQYRGVGGSGRACLKVSNSEIHTFLSLSDQKLCPKVSDVGLGFLSGSPMPRAGPKSYSYLLDKPIIVKLHPILRFCNYLFYCNFLTICRNFPLLLLYSSVFLTILQKHQVDLVRGETGLVRVTLTVNKSNTETQSLKCN